MEFIFDSKLFNNYKLNVQLLKYSYIESEEYKNSQSLNYLVKDLVERLFEHIINQLYIYQMKELMILMILMNFLK